MTISHAIQDLRRSTSRLSEAVTELVMIAHEDRPHGSEIAAVDAFAEQVSELQSSVVLAVHELARIEGPAHLADRMSLVDRSLASAGLRYWRDLRAYDATVAMRQAARRGGSDWRAWQVSIEQSQERCEQPLIDATTGVRAVWLELAELVSLWLSHAPPPPPPSLLTVEPGAEPAPENTWRST
jgi:hypothetical protein